MKPISFKIPKTEQSSFHVQVDEAAGFYDRLHQHPEWQITAIHKGEGVLLAGNSSSPFQTGDVFILGSNTPHLLKNDTFRNKASSKGVCSISIFFHLESFGNGFFDLPELKELKAFLTKSQRGIIYTGMEKEILHKRISNCVEKKDLALLVEFLSILDQMKNSASPTYINDEAYLPQSKAKTDDRINQVINYTLQNLHKDITLEKIADVASLSVSQFCRYFKLHTQKTYVQFLNELRIETACSHLQKYDHTVERISAEVGFQNLSHFNRQFKKIKQVTPSAFRNDFR